MWTWDDADGRDDAAQAQAETRLRELPELADCAIRCAFHDGVLTLSGRVPRYSLKQAARSLVRRIQGVEGVDNRIDVIPLPASEQPCQDRGAIPGDDYRRTE